MSKPMEHQDDNGATIRGRSWLEERSFVLAEIKRQNATIILMDSKIDAIRTTELAEIKVTLAVLTTKMAVIAGVCSFLGAAIVSALTKLLS